MTDKIHFILNVIIYFMNFTAIICLMYVVGSDKLYFDLSQQLFDNWDLGPIIQIQIQQSLPCEKGMESILLNAFPGIEEGCNCNGITSIPGDTSLENKITSGLCSLMAVNEGCKVIRGIYKKNETQIYNRTICVKRNSEMNYKNIYFNDMINSCDDINIGGNKKSCGEIDSLGNILCVLNNESCPFLYNDTSEYIDNREENEEYYQSKIMSEIMQSYKSLKNYDHNIKSKSNQGYLCIYNCQSKKEKFSLLSQVTKLLYYNVFSDKSINKTRNKGMFTTNKMANASFNNSVIDFEELSNIPFPFFDDPIILYNRNYIGWKLKCKNYLLDMYMIPVLSMNVMQFSTMYLISSLFILFYCLLFIIVCKEVAEQNLFSEAFLIFIHLTLIIFVFEMIVKDYIILLKCIKLLEIVINKGCTDIETIIILVGLYNTSSGLEKLYFEAMTLFGFMIPLSLFKFGLLAYKWYKEYLISLVLLRMPIMEFEMTLL